jgi:two-component system chemotaxis sensor kinase CheA
VENEFSKDEALVNEFVIESEELLQGMDQDMVSLEAAPRDAELLNRVFRALHSIKGTSGFLGFDPVVRLSHRAEDVLNALRRGDITLSRRTIDALLSARDQLGQMLRDIRHGSLGEYALDPLLEELDVVQKPPSTPPKLGELLIANKVIDRAVLEQSLAEASQTGQRLGDLLVAKGTASAAQVGEAVAQQKRLAESAADSHTLRVDARKLDELINLIGELVLERNRLVQLSRDVTQRSVSAEKLEAGLSQATARLSFITEELQATGLKTRMVPVEMVFRKFPRLVRDLARSLQKEVQLELTGRDTEIDRTFVELISDPLVHLVRNSLDHGIEPPGIRAAQGKRREGTIRMEASQEGDQIVISVSDDGAGIDCERVLQKAIDRGLVNEARGRALNRQEILEFVFLPGFSTIEKANDVSGRGVGLDVVRSNLKKLNGTIVLDSRAGLGTCITLKLPLTLAILPVLLVQVGKEVYALPLRAVLETVRVEEQDIHWVEGGEVLRLRQQALPLLRLAELFCVEGTESGEKGNRAVILQVGEKQVALLVDRLVGQESTVVKPLGSCLCGCSSFAGAIIGGDGSVRLVLDPPGLLAELTSTNLAFLTRKVM